MINEINGVEPDCILSALPSPRGEQFVVESRALLNARLWVGGLSVFSEEITRRPLGKIGQFIMKKIFSAIRWKSRNSNFLCTLIEVGKLNFFVKSLRKCIKKVDFLFLFS